ncbi:MAG: hypothetical protein JW717_01590 [Marinilabiliaceae bacterium]|nr:hypothetical protein [Marinilabiliaceae bacterium]
MKKLILLFFSINTLFFVACSDDDDNTPDNPSGDKVVIIDKNITTPTVWNGNDTVYIIKKYDFYVSNSLTIQSGAIIKFHPSAGPYMMLGNGGTIMAIGSNTEPIIFTSYKDDEHGGDNNGDGTTTHPLPGDWYEINTNGNNGSNFKYCEFYYGGGGSYHASLTLMGNNLVVDHCTFAFNKGGKMGDFYYGVLNASDAEKNTTITNNIFFNNNLPLSMESVISIDNSNIFSNPGNSSETNNMNGIFIYSYDDFYTATLWQETEVPFVINDNDLWIESSGSLTLGNNVAIKFTPSSTLVIQEGGALNQGSAIKFTSIKDDTVKGDTNGDGNATSPNNGDWNGIYNDISSTYYTWSNIYYDNH